MRNVGTRLIVGFAFGFTFFPQLSSSVAQAADTVVRIQEMPGSIPMLSSWAMTDKGFCKKNGLDCQRVSLPTGPLAQQAALTGGVDFIFTALGLTMQADAKGADLLAIGLAELNPAYVLVMRSDLAQPNRSAGYPKNMLDLKGRTVGVAARGSDTEIYTRALLVGAGMSADDVTFVGVGAPNTAFPALQTKQLDAVMSWAPIDQLCKVTKVCDVVVDLRKGQGPAEIKELNGGFAAWQARRQYIEKHGAEVDAFSRALGEATAWVVDPKNLAEVMGIARQHLKLTDLPGKEQMLTGLVNDEIAQYSTHFDRGVVAGFNNFLIKNKLLTEPSKPEAIIWPKTP